MATIPDTAERSTLASLFGEEPFSHCSRAVADRLEAIATVLTLSAGETLAGKGDGDRLVFITRGSAKLVSCTAPHGSTPIGSEGENRHILAFQFPGDIVSIPSQRAGGAYLVALGELDLVAFDAREFLDAAEGDPALLRGVLVRSLDTIQRNRKRMMRLGHRSARQRIAGFLVTMAERIAGCTEGPCEFALPMGRGDIGDSLGLTIETVSRQFTELRNEGLVTTKGRALVHLSDIDRLRHEAGP